MSRADSKNTKEENLQKGPPQIDVRLHPEKDADIVQFLEDQHITDVTKKLIRFRIWADEVDLPFALQFFQTDSSALAGIKKEVIEQLANIKKPKKKKERKRPPRIHVRLHPEKDADIIRFLENKHVSDTIKKLFQIKIWANQMASSLTIQFGQPGTVIDEPVETKREEVPVQAHNPFAVSQEFIKEEEKTSVSVDLFN